MENDIKDLEILKALYYGNHLNDDDLSRAYTLVNLLKVSIKGRLNA